MRPAFRSALYALAGSAVGAVLLMLAFAAGDDISPGRRLLLGLSSAPLGSIDIWTAAWMPLLWSAVGLLLSLATKRWARTALRVLLAVHYIGLLLLFVDRPVLGNAITLDRHDIVRALRETTGAVVLGFALYVAMQVVIWLLLDRSRPGVPRSVDAGAKPGQQPQWTMLRMVLRCGAFALGGAAFGAVCLALAFSAGEPLPSTTQLLLGFFSAPLASLDVWMVFWGTPLLWATVGLLLSLATHRRARIALRILLAVHYIGVLLLFADVRFFEHAIALHRHDFSSALREARDPVITGILLYVAMHTLVWTLLDRRCPAAPPGAGADKEVAQTVRQRIFRLASRIVAFGLVGFGFGILLLAIAWGALGDGNQRPQHLLNLCTWPMVLIADDGWLTTAVTPLLWCLVGVVAALIQWRMVRRLLLAYLSLCLFILGLAAVSLMSKHGDWHEVYPHLLPGGAIYLIGQAALWIVLLRAMRRDGVPSKPLTGRQFAVRGTLLVLFLCLPTGLMAAEYRRAERQRQLREQVAALGGATAFGDLSVCEYCCIEPPDWWIPVFGKDCLMRVGQISLKGTKATDDDFEQLAGLGTVYGLSLSDTRISDEGLEYLRRLPNMVALDLSGTHVTDAGLAHLSDLTRLHNLNLANTRITDAGLAHLQGLDELHTLNVSHTRVTGVGFAALEELRIWNLDLEGSGLDDAGLKIVAKLPDLSRLSLAKTQITDDGVRHLKTGEGLCELDLPHTDVTDAALEHIGEFTDLRGLSLAGTRITDAGLVHLRTLKNIEELDLSSTAVTGRPWLLRTQRPNPRWRTWRSSIAEDAGTRALTRMQNLRRLRLAGTHVTDATLAYMKYLPYLDFLDLDDTQVTDAGLKLLYDMQLSGVSAVNTRISADGARAFEEKNPYSWVKR